MSGGLQATALIQHSSLIPSNRMRSSSSEPAKVIDAGHVQPMAGHVEGLGDLGYRQPAGNLPGMRLATQDHTALA